jgi:hypothetical protein
MRVNLKPNFVAAMAALIIEQGSYLEPQFCASSLTVPQLRGILHYHGVDYPTRCNKNDLLVLFDNKIKGNAQLRDEHAKGRAVQASAEGIYDGITGQPVHKVRKKVCRSVSQIHIRSYSPLP